MDDSCGIFQNEGQVWAGTLRNEEELLRSLGLQTIIPSQRSCEGEGEVAIMQHGRWYAKVALFSASVGAGMEFFMIRTGFYEKVVDLEAQRRAEELQAAKEQIDASRTLQQHPDLTSLASKEGTVGPS